MAAIVGKLSGQLGKVMCTVVHLEHPFPQGMRSDKVLCTLKRYQQTSSLAQGPGAYEESSYFVSVLHIM